MARVRIAKATSGAAFVSKKKACEARLAAQEAGEEVEPYDDIFELQHHHLLRCLEKATVSVNVKTLLLFVLIFVKLSTNSCATFYSNLLRIANLLNKIWLRLN